MTKSNLTIFLLLLLSTTLALGVKDPELKQCRHQCKVQQQYDEEQKRECTRKCEEYIKEKQQREEQERGGEGSNQGIESQSPYVFEEQHFTTRIQTQHGRFRVLPKFTERSELLKGIKNYRFSILEADPQTFIVPNHFDADAVIFVAQGKGTISLVRQDKRESINIGRGDIVRVPAGTTTYLINRHNNQRLILAKLLQPVNTPGEFEHFFGPGGENPESFFRAFSDEILEAAFNTRRDRLQRIFRQQNQGIIIKASEEQIRALSQHKEGGIWPFGGGTKGKINIFEEGPKKYNQYGQFFEVDSSDYRQLEDLDIAITLANISAGSMTAPLYNSRVAKISVVTNGEGYFEMICPHLSSQGGQGSQEQQGGGQGSQQQQGGRGGSPRYQKVSARLRPGTVVIVPPGHPFVAVASNNQNLEVVCFEINASRNEKFPLAGRWNVINQLEDQAKELAFGVPARQVNEVFNKQQEEFFFRGPHQQQQEGRADA